MLTINVTTFRRSIFEILDSVVEYNKSVTVTTKKGNAVIFSEKDYNAMTETIYLSSNDGLDKRIKHGDKEKPTKMSRFDPQQEW